MMILISWVFLLGWSIFATDTEAEKIAEQWNILADTLIKAIDNWKISFTQWKTIIEWWIDYYMEKVRKMSEKDLPNLFTFELINWRIIQDQLLKSTKKISNNGRNYTFASYGIRDSLLFVDEKAPAKDIMWDQFSQELIMPWKESDIYIIRTNVDWEKSLWTLLIAYWEWKTQSYVDKNKNTTTIEHYSKTIKPFGVFVNKGWESVFYRNKNFDSSTYSSMWIDSEPWTVYFVYIVPKTAQDIKLTFENNMSKPAISISKLDNFKYSSDVISTELEKMKWAIPFCLRALWEFSNFKTEKMRNCESAYQWNFREGMSEWLFKQRNDENNRPYSIKIMSSGVGTNYCKETQWGQDCLWVDDGKLTSLTSYDYK